jgi:acyl carrier protein
MNITKFILALETEFEELEPGTIKSDTNFRDLDEWSSMHALIIIALIDTDFNVSITGEDLSNIETVSQLFDIVIERMK